ncbi:MAG TPA: alginate export family protein [Phycisphaerae bacterium]|nr:alginate export family protein [Phycisphaerae bacterium]
MFKRCVIFGGALLVLQGPSIAQPPASTNPTPSERSQQPQSRADQSADVVEIPTTSAPAETESDENSAPLPGPEYLRLRYDEDYSYLDGPPGSYQPDVFDPVKRIRVSDDLILSLGGEARVMVHSLTNPGYGTNFPTQDTYLWHQYFLHADLRYRDTFRIFAEGVNAMIEDQDFPLRTFDEDRFDVHQLFADWRVLGDHTPLTLRVGRQALSYGRRRQVNYSGWSQFRRTFDGVKLLYKSDDLLIDAWYVKPINMNLAEGLNRKPNRYQEEQDFYGIYATWKGIKDHEIDLYLLALIDHGNPTNANFRSGDLSAYTFGGRIGGKIENWDYDGELAGQWGKFAGDTISAWMAGVDGGYTLADGAWKPRLGVGFDWGSGDQDSTDNVHQTYTTNFSAVHSFLGHIDLFTRQNIISPNLNLTLTPHKKVTAKATWYTFWNDSVTDGIANGLGQPVRRDRFGNPGHDIGQELDLTINVSIDTHQTLLFGYSHFWPSNFISATGFDDEVDFIYLGYTFRF